MRSSFKSVPEKQVPNTAPPLSTFWSSDSHKIWVALGDGSVVALNDLITFGPPAKAIGPQGEPGAPCICRNGKDGKDGRDGRDGIDARDAVGAVGPQGRTGAEGAPGKDAHQRVELDNLLIESRREIKKLRAEFTALKADFQGILDMNKSAAAYIEYLRSKAAARQTKESL
jgi:hypothetical protein